MGASAVVGTWDHKCNGPSFARNCDKEEALSSVRLHTTAAHGSHRKNFGGAPPRGGWGGTKRLVNDYTRPTWAGTARIIKTEYTLERHEHVKQGQHECVKTNHATANAKTESHAVTKTHRRICGRSYASKHFSSATKHCLGPEMRPPARKEPRSIGRVPCGAGRAPIFHNSMSRV